MGSTIMVFDLAAIQTFCNDSTAIMNLNEAATRAHHLPVGSFGDTWAIQSRELLLAVPTLPFTTQQGIPLVIGVIDSQQARQISSHPP
jgi:hypothetical protein